MLELLQTFSRVAVAFLSGVLLIAGTTFWADVLGDGDSAFDQVAGMLNGEFKNIFIVITVESLQQPQLLKEALDLLQLKRTLVAFALPLFYFGLALACDFKESSFSHLVRAAAGISLAGLAVLAPLFASRMTRILDAAAKKLLAETPTKPVNPPGTGP